MYRSFKSLPAVILALSLILTLSLNFGFKKAETAPGNAECRVNINIVSNADKNCYASAKLAINNTGTGDIAKKDITGMPDGNNGWFRSWMILVIIGAVLLFLLIISLLVSKKKHEKARAAKVALAKVEKYGVFYNIDDEKKFN